ncbi:hypothetical protein [Lentzea sp. NBRC 102530]|uniref:hypothetical protein n=1 Tax=Lentzea sp. NBRC 102530 TaxID=3032201 RepID=UPI0024A4E4E1|nr:hypothetical protein [Lentzea sp. NBRC 102530]GLY46935.1 hypothetical protein Lesp01_05910 [Lentzea sp. NBRC 102530]
MRSPSEVAAPERPPAGRVELPGRVRQLPAPHRRRLGLVVRTGHRVTGIDELRERYEKVVVTAKPAQIIVERPVYPSAEAVRNGWFDEVNALQGRDGAHFAGEVLSGPTAECITAYVRDVIPAWFGRA